MEAAKEREAALVEYRNKLTAATNEDEMATYKEILDSLLYDDRLASGYAYNTNEAYADRPISMIVPENPELASLCGIVYNSLFGDPDDYFSLGNDAELLQPFREMLARTSLKLNAFEWSQVISPTDDFVVCNRSRAEM